MELYKKDVLAIFRKNFNFPIIQTPMGEAVKMDAVSAFLFANVTGARYFDNPTFPFTPNGTQQILRGAFQFNLVTGIYEGAALGYAPMSLAQSRPFLFNGDKFIIFREIADECQFSEDLQDEYDALNEAGHTTTDYIISRIETSKKGNGMEPFLEYLACEYFKKQGYMVENQIPLAANVGSPDFGGYKLVESLNGFHINELALIRITKDFKITESLSFDSVIVGEAKTATTTMEKQLRKYMNTGLFKKGYEMHPDKSAPSVDSFGLLNIGSDYIVSCKEPETAYTSSVSSTYKLNEYLAWIQQYAKFYLMANFTQEEFDKIIKEKTGKQSYSSDNIIGVISQMSVKEIIERIKGVL